MKVIPMIDPFENYHKDQLTIDLIKANVFAVVLILPTALIFALPYYLIWGFEFNLSAIRSFKEFLSPELFGLSIVIMIIGGIVLHELIHGITWSRFTSDGFKSIKFGVLWKMLTPYCHCKQPLKVREYILGAVMPAIILGFLPALIAIAIGNMALLIFGIFFTIAACGDFMVINLLKNENKDDYVQDHPTEPGCFIFRKKGKE